MPGVECGQSPRKQHEGSHLIVFEGDQFVYVAIPPLFSTLLEEGKSLEEAGCTLPMPWDSSNKWSPTVCHEGLEHVHTGGCGHNRIAHGDHQDWLKPQQDGSYLLSHAQATADGLFQFIEHGQLVKVGESRGQLKKQCTQLIDVFGYVSPKKREILEPDVHHMAEEHQPHTTAEDKTKVYTANRPDPEQNTKNCLLNCRATSAKSEVFKPVEVTIPANYNGQEMTKTSFDIMGLCCPAEVGLVRKILEPLPGIKEVSINAATKSATLLHDPVLITDIQIVKILNEAHLDATIHERGVRRLTNKWPSPWTIASGILLAVALFHYVYNPLKWVALASVGLTLPHIVLRSFISLRRFRMDINCLMLIAIGGAIALGDYVEAGTIAFLFTLADWLESRSSDTARDALSSVLELAPQTAVLLDGKRVRVEHVQVGTLLAVKAGEHIPIDGKVISGKSTVDESSVTGESKPVGKQDGQHVWAGTLNLSGYITIQTNTLAKDSAIARMVHLVEEAQRQHSPTEQLVEKFAVYYTPVVVIAALITAVVPTTIHTHNYRHWVYVALVFLVAACPCALVISTPVTTTCSIAQAAREGLIVKGGRHLEMLGKVKLVALDKTGTLTEGHFRVLTIDATEGHTTLPQLLLWITSVENKSNHPLAPALISYCRNQGLEPSDDVTDFEVLAGEGVTAIVGGQRIYIGNSRLATRLGWQNADKEMLEEWYNLGATVIWIGVKENLIGVAAVADQLRSEAIEAVDGLKALGIKIRMLTGDSAAAASVVRRQIGQDIVVHSELLPEDKVKFIKEMKKIGATTMVGDGINDAPALAAADVGIAMGVAGSAIAMETADVALMTNNLCKLVVAIKLGRRCRTKILQNIFFSFFTKIIIIVIAAAGNPSLWAAVLTDVGTCLVVIFNSMQLLNSKKIAQETSGHSHHRHFHWLYCFCRRGNKQEKIKSCCTEVTDQCKHLQNKTKGNVTNCCSGEQHRCVDKQDNKKGCSMEANQHHLLCNNTKAENVTNCCSGGFHHQCIDSKDNIVKDSNLVVAHKHHHGCEHKEQSAKRCCSGMALNSHDHNKESKGEHV